jgi:hypothetical protein
MKLPRTMAEWEARLDDAGRAKVASLLAGRAAGGDARALRQEFVALLQAQVPDAPPAMLHALWGEATQPARPAVEPLEELIPRLPYPLSLTAGQWLREWKRTEEGEPPGRLPFLACRVMGVAVRLAAAMAVRALVELKSKDAALNAVVHRRLRSPSDGAWLELAREVGRAAARHEWGSFLLEVLEASHRPSHPAWAGPAGGGRQRTAAAMSELVGFRNRLVHGTPIDAAGHRRCGAQVEVLLRGFAWLAGHRLIVRWKGTDWVLAGAMPHPAGREPDRLPPGVPEGEVVLVDPAGGRRPLSLAPLLVFRPRGGEDLTVDLDELWFLNAGALERLHYIGYRTTAVVDGRGLESYESFRAMLATLEAPPIPADPRLDFTDLVRFHEPLFVGRGDVLEEIERFVRRRPAPWAVLTALPGMGKSAIMAMLYKRHVLREGPAAEDLWIFHFCSPVDGRNGPTATLRSLMAQLCDAAGIARADWLSTDLEELRDRRMPGLVREVAGRLPPGRRLVIAVDALDEGFGAEKDPVASAFTFRLPDNAAGLLTWRVPSAETGNQRVEAALRPWIPPDLRRGLAAASPLAGLGRRDVARLIRRLAADAGVAPSATMLAATWKAAALPSEGAGADPLFLRLVADGMLTGEVRPDRAETVPASLDDAFEEFWMTLPRERDFLVHRVLIYLAILREPGTDALLAQLIQRERPGELVTEEDVARVRIHAGKLLVYEGERYRLFHERFRHFLVGAQGDPVAEALASAGAE